MASFCAPFCLFCVLFLFLNFFAKKKNMLLLQLENKSFLKFLAAGCGNTREAEAGGSLCRPVCPIERVPG